MIALNLSNDGRILSGCIVLDNGNYEGETIVDALPHGNLFDYRFVNGEYIYDPIPEAEEPESVASIESRVETLETSNAELTEAVDMILSGVTSDE